MRARLPLLALFSTAIVGHAACGDTGITNTGGSASGGRSASGSGGARTISGSGSGDASSSGTASSSGMSSESGNSTSGGSGGSGSDSGGGGGGGGGGADGGTCASGPVAVPAAERVPKGNPILPPKWAFGVLWGSYYDQNGTYKPAVGDGNLVNAAARLRSDGYGGDLLWIDSSWLYNVYNSAAAAPYYIDFKFDTTAFPDPATMLANFHKDHFHFGVWEWPWIDHTVMPYAAQGVAMGYFNGTGAGWHGDTTPYQVDFTKPAAMAWWQGLNQPLAMMGLDFMKLDTLTGTGQYRDAYHQAATAVTKVYPAANNPDAMLNGARGFILAHGDNNDSPGNDQTPGMWTGDTPATWAGFAGGGGGNADMITAQKLNKTTNAAYWCGDTGGYNNAPTDELYIRWLQYSTFTPLQEFFGAKAPGIGARWPWLFGNTVTQLPAITKLWNQLRYRLLPFRYSNAQAAYHVTPLKYPVAWSGNALMLSGDGDSQVVVQPVTSAGQMTTPVTLPAGMWIPVQVAPDASFVSTGLATTGTVTARSPIDQEPIFVKAGSIIPMSVVLAWVDEHPADPLTLDIYPAGATSYTLYEDDGMSDGYLGGAFATTKLASDDSSGHEVVTIGAQAIAKYDFTGRLCSRTYVLKINGRASAPAMVTRDGSSASPLSSAAAFGAATEGWFYDSAAKTVWVKFPLPSTATTNVSVQ